MDGRSGQGGRSEERRGGVAAAGQGQRRKGRRRCIRGPHLLCRKKRGVNNTLLKCKVRCVLCGNHVVASAKRGVSKTTVNLRTHSPAVRAPSLKMNFAVGVLDDLRMLDFDFDAAYLQGHYVYRRVFARAPLFLRKYDEHGVEYVWQLQRALYGGWWT